jgi:hypothetical protein
METLNGATLKDLQNEVQSKVDLMDVLAKLTELLSIERRERGTGGKSIGKDRVNNEVVELRRKVDEL